jgi:hypothetical protein
MAHNGTESNRRAVAGRSLALLALVLGCSDEGELPTADARAVGSANADDSGALDGLDAARSGSDSERREAGAAASDVDGRARGAQPAFDGALARDPTAATNADAGDAGLGSKADAGDGGTRDAPPLGDASCEQERAFLNEHRACSTQQDCAIVGSCSGGFGFRAVQAAVKDEAQRLSNNTSCGRAFDGPMYAAVCEQGLCRTRPTGAWCGAAPSSQDGGRMGCAPGEAQYRTDCEGPSAATGKPTCERSCNGATDTSCGAGRMCTSVRVSAGQSGYGTSCDALVDVWLCRAPR